MRGNRRRGFKRLAIALGLPWFGWWGFVAIVNYYNYRDATGRIDAAVAVDGEISFVDIATQSSSMNMLGLAAFWGAILPLLMLFAVAAAYWVYRGFKPR